MYNPPVDLYQKLRDPLSLPLSLDRNTLAQQLIELNTLQYELAYTRCEWLQKLYEARQRVLIPKDDQYAKMTELDRRTALEANTAPIEKDLRFMEALESIVQERLELGRLLLI